MKTNTQENITYISLKTGDIYTLTKWDDESGKVVITDKEGGHHLIGINTLKKNYKKAVQEPENNPDDKKSSPKDKNSKKTQQNKQGTTLRKNIKGDPGSVGENEVIMVAFTGMLIGVFEVYKTNKGSILVKTAKGTLKFDKNTGVQLDAANKRFAID